MAIASELVLQQEREEIVKLNGSLHVDLNIWEVIKKDGSRSKFDFTKISRSVEQAGKDTKAYTKRVADMISLAIAEKMKGFGKREITTAEIRDIVEPAIAEAGYFQTAKYYILFPVYREQARRAAVTEEARQKTEESKQYFRNELSELVYYQFYARWKDELGRRETWTETVDRFMEFMHMKMEDKFTKKEYEEMRQGMLKQDVIPSMRLVWAAGDAAAKNNVMAYNCSFISPSSFEDFGEIMYIMMCGVGLGFSVMENEVGKLPEVKVQTGKMLKTFVVKDSKEGWADAFIKGMRTWFGGADVAFDYSQIRPHGARLLTMGGRAAGPEALEAALEFAKTKILAKQGRKLNTLDVHDIICKIGEIVVAGGVRRNAMISLSDLNDEAMRQAKSGAFYTTEPQRSMANNSAVYNQKPTSTEFLEEWLSIAKSGSGERGIFNRRGLETQLPERRWKTFEKHLNTAGTNPCGEIVLRSKQFCNLTAIVVRPNDDEESLMEKIRLATMLGTFQASLTDFPYLSKEWKENCEEEALLGVSFTGYWDNKKIRDGKLLAKLRDHTVKVNKIYAKRIGINQSTCVTCVKPSGNSSQLLDTASGMHPRYAPYYVRRVRISAVDPLFRMLKDQGVPYHPEVGQNPDTARTYVLEFPVKAPKGAITKDDVSAVELLEQWKLIKTEFTEHNPSATIYVGEGEWLEVGQWVYQNWDVVGGLTFLPRTNHVYKLAPYEEITKEEFEVLSKQIPAIDFSQLALYEMEDMTEGAKELACVGGACEV